MNSTIIENVKKSLQQALDLNENTEISMTAKLKDDLGLDSMSSLTFLITLEENIEKFTVNPESLEMSDLESVETISNYVFNQVNYEQAIA